MGSYHCRISFLGNCCGITISTAVPHCALEYVYNDHSTPHFFLSYIYSTLHTTICTVLGLMFSRQTPSNPHHEGQFITRWKRPHSSVRNPHQGSGPDLTCIHKLRQAKRDWTPTTLKSDPPSSHFHPVLGFLGCQPELSSFNPRCQMV